MEIKTVNNQRRYLKDLTRCVRSLKNLENRPKVVDEIFEALLLQATLDYQYFVGLYIKEKRNEKKEKKNER